MIRNLIQAIDKDGRSYYFSEDQWKIRRDSGEYVRGISVIISEPGCEATPFKPCHCGE